MSSTNESEIEITLTSEKLADDDYIKRVLIDTKLKVLKEIADASDGDFNAMVMKLCPEVAAPRYSDLVTKFGITILKKTDSKLAGKPKISLKKKPSLKKPSTPVETDSSPPTVVPVTEEDSSPPTVVPVTEEASSPPTVVPVTEEATSPSTKVKKKKTLKRKPKAKKAD